MTWKSLLLAAVLTVCVASSAQATGLSLHAIAGPDGNVPFRSAGGYGTTFAVSAPGDPHRLYVGTLDGYVYVVKDGVTQAQPFLDIHSRVSVANGMFSMVFDPGYNGTSDRWFYLSYADTSSPNYKIDRLNIDAFQTASSNRDAVASSTPTKILIEPTTGCIDAASPHYGGQLQVGPDNHVWLTIGDGGDGGGSVNAVDRGPGCDRPSPLNAPDLTTLKGKIIRIDPAPTAAPDANGNRYSIPSDNPLVGQSGVRTEIWASGLRNPYRFSFDPAPPHDLWIGDVGNGLQEEVDHVSSATVAGSPDFFGWPCMEGALGGGFYGSCAPCQMAQCAQTGWPILPADIVPVSTLDHQGACAAVIGGVVARDPTLGGDYYGRYLYGYYCAHDVDGQNYNGQLLTLDPASPGTSRNEGIGVGPYGLSSFGTDTCGHVYVSNENTGGLWRVEGATTPTCGNPDTTITSSPSDPSPSTSASIAFKAGEPATFTCQLDGGTATACTSPKSYSSLAQGTHTVSVAATDSYGDVESSPATASWTVDTGPPGTTIGPGGTSGTVASTSASIPFSASESDVTFSCKLDATAAAPCSSPYTKSGLGQGVHTLKVTATDAAGSVEAAPPSRTWTVDTVNPTVAITGGPADGSITGNGAPSFSFTATDATALTVTCALDSGSATTCASPKSYSGLADGSHTFTITAVDAAGNSDVESRTWTIDTTSPVVAITGGPAGGSTTASGAPSFSFTATDANTLTVTCALDAGTAGACGSPKTYSGLSDGAHAFTVTASDPAGHTSSATRTWTIDSVAPSVAITAGPANGSTTAVKVPAFSFTATDATALTITCTLDAGAATTCASPKSYAAQADGQHTFTVSATDAAGTTTSKSVTWTIDSVNPVVTITSGPGNATTTTDPDPSFGFTATDATALTVTCARDGGTASACTSPKNYAGLADGSHTFTVTATDAAGNTASASRTWTIDTGNPVVTIDSGPSNGSTVMSQSATFTFTSGDASATVTCSRDGAMPTPCTSPVNYANLAEGSHTFTVTATDPVGNHGSDTRSWTIDRTPPAVSITSGPATGSTTASRAPSFAFTATDASALTVTCALDGGAAGACASPKAYSGLSDGSHTFTVTATDAAGNTSSATRTWTVDATPPAVSITAGPATGSAQSDRTPAFSFTATDATAVTYSCKLDATTAACTSPNTYPTQSEGSHTFTVTATDAAGNTGTATRTWTIDATAPTVAITAGPADGSVSTDPTPTFSFTAADATTVTTACSLDGASAACTSPKTYAAQADGSHTFTVTATDAAGNHAAASRTWTVDTTPPGTSIDSGPAARDDHHNATFTFSSHDDATATFRCSLDGATATACTSPKTYGPLADGPHTVKVTAVDPAGNADLTPASFSWQIDTTGPDTSIGAGPSAITSSTSATFTLSATKPGSTFRCTLDGADLGVCSSPVTYTSLADGMHTLSVVATDTSDNPDPTPATRTWTVDATAPVVSIDAPAPPSGTDTSATIHFSATDVATVTLTCALDGAPAAACTSPATVTGLAVGAHVFKVTATDAAGNVGTTQAVWTVSAPPPPPTTTQQQPPPTITGSSAPPTTTTTKKPTPKPKPKTPAKPKRAALKVSFVSKGKLTLDAKGRVSLKLAGLSEGARAKLSVRRGSTTIVNPVSLRLPARQAITLRVGLPSASDLVGKRVTVTVSLTGTTDHKTVISSATFTIAAAPRH